MLLMKCCYLTARNDVREQFAESAGLDGLGVVAHVGPVQAVLFRELVIQPDGEIIFGGHLLRSEGVNSGVASRLPIGQWVKRREKPRYPTIHIHRARGKLAAARRN